MISQTLTMFTAWLWWPFRSLFILELGASKEILGALLMIDTIVGNDLSITWGCVG
ncbi:MAG: hypothetical protein GWN62_24680 [Aliifodinibius sp.]|nr:hypothetical protein [Fodinibius sp.]